MNFQLVRKTSSSRYSNYFFFKEQSPLVFKKVFCFNVNSINLSFLWPSNCIWNQKDFLNDSPNKNKLKWNKVLSKTGNCNWTKKNWIHPSVKQKITSKQSIVERIPFKFVLFWLLKFYLKFFGFLLRLNGDYKWTQYQRSNGNTCGQFLYIPGKCRATIVSCRWHAWILW